MQNLFLNAEEMRKRRIEKEVKEISKFLDDVVEQIKEKNWSVECVRAMGQMLGDSLVRSINTTEKGALLNKTQQEIMQAKFADLFVQTNEQEQPA